MAADNCLSSAQIVALSGDFNALGNHARSILNDPNLTLTPGQSAAISADLTSLSTMAAQLATWAALIAFADSEAAFASISAATTSANATVAKLKSTIAKINAIVAILGDAVSLGVAFGTGSWSAVIGAAGTLGGTVAAA
jgi:hypothetical protein